MSNMINYQIKNFPADRFTSNVNALATFCKNYAANPSISPHYKTECLGWASALQTCKPFSLEMFTFMYSDESLRAGLNQLIAAADTKNFVLPKTPPQEGLKTPKVPHNKKNAA